MSDLVRRLRMRVSATWGGAGPAMQEAADRIEADEALMRQALDALEWVYGGEPLPTLEIAAINALRARLGDGK